jgi:hypothetical protein
LLCSPHVLLLSLPMTVSLNQLIGQGASGKAYHVRGEGQGQGEGEDWVVKVGGECGGVRWGGWLCGGRSWLGGRGWTDGIGRLD